LILQLQEQKIEDEIVKLQVKIKGLNDDHIKIEELIKNNESERFKHEQWIYNFKKFKSFLANKSIKSIEVLSNLTLKRMNSALQVQLEGYGLLKSRELREKITTSILRDGFNEGSFFKFSGGERGDIEIATISALQQLINFNTESGGLDILIIDEILESIDGVGLAEVAKAASKLNKTIGLITHVSIPSDDHYEIVTVEKRNKISKII
jgi:Fe-S cluster assembly ATPase SufC